MPFMCLQTFGGPEMAVFRDEEARERGFEHAKRILIPREGTPGDRKKALEALQDLVDELGPVVDSYPSWHPLVAQPDGPISFRTPHARYGYEGLDHTIFFAHGFVTCPYPHAVEKVISSVEAIKVPDVATLTAECIDSPLYSTATTTIVVRCNWKQPLDPGKLVPKRLAIGLMLDTEIPHWHHAEVAETWETMRGHFLGEPHGARSSFFVSQETAMAMKRIWISLIESGVFGPVYH